MFVNIEMYIYNGPIHRWMAKDPTIVDFASAVAHEYNKHLNPAADAVEKWAKSWVVSKPSMAECEAQCPTIKAVGPHIYEGVFEDSKKND